jgi:hypothetical protein
MTDESPNDASQQLDTNQVPTPPTENQTPKFELKDGSMVVDGRKVVYESDLIAAKKSLQEQLESAQSVHNEAFDKAKLNLSEAQTQLAAANARVKQMEETAQKGAVSEEDAARQKQEIEAAKSRADTAETRVLELRRDNLLAKFPNRIKPEQLENKTEAELAALEEALKVVSANSGPGEYLIPGGGNGGGSLSDMDRARAIINNTPFRGVREVPAQN